MTTRFEGYIAALGAEIRAIPGFPAAVERSIVRAFSEVDRQGLVLRGGKEVVVPGAPIPMADRLRELQCIVISWSDAPDADASALAELFHPVVMRYRAEGITGITEVGTDEPKYGPDGIKAAVIVVRYRIAYRTLEDSLSQ
ncbi:hypothetical protein [Cupriavidus alkaliphilus]|uniref:hypothetical protein n=1 Tax=Cupriavidus alkaliphilus TaxID=942866 RepID=UPI00339D7EFB